MREQASERGFSLIELSIVLVIIGLIVGGVLVGQNLIAAAGVRAMISHIEKYNTAVNTFRTKYNNQLPGDIDAADAAQFGFIARGSFAGEGDGNGVIESNWNNLATSHDGFHWCGETDVFWVDLSTAHLIDGNFNTATSVGCGTGSNITGAGIDAYLPPGKIGGGNYISIWSQNSINYFSLAAVTMLSNGALVVASPALTVQQASSIDAKIDDGLPQSGFVTAQYLSQWLAPVWADPTFHDTGTYTTATSPSATTCYDNGGVGGATQKYSLAQNGGAGVNCALSFQFQ